MNWFAKYGRIDMTNKNETIVTATTIFSIWFDKLQMQLCDITIWNKKADQV